ncbi:MAG: S41 family peptidase [Bacteroidetes bacterium]|nr:S41 family peptidase [Bacteroidota bacterium]
MAHRRILVLCLLFSTFGVSCTKSDHEQAPRLVQKVNNFIYEYMDEVYLWTAEMPRNIDRKYEFDSKDYFDKLLYKPEDKWSYITDDYEALSEGSEGVETTFGYSLAFGRFTGTDYYFGIIEYVYHNTPAEQAGLKRGDIIYKMNGSNIDANNYIRLYNDPSLSLQMGVLSDGGIGPGMTVNLIAVKMQLSAIIEEKVIEIEGHKIGYLFYSDFFGGSEEELSGVFQRFKAAGVDDVVLDLRYNLGGYGYVATHLASILAPANVVQAENVMITYQWNASYQAYWEQQKEYDRIRTLFDKRVPVNMDLNRVYVLTTYNTASASEFVITGLDPYMEVIKIGAATRGKYTGSILFQAEDKEIKNWGIQPIVERYANSLGVTNFKDGFTPDYAVTDLLMEGVRQLGDAQESFLAKALTLITGVSAPAVAAAPNTGSDFDVEESMNPRNDYFKGSVLRKTNYTP